MWLLLLLLLQADGPATSPQELAAGGKLYRRYCAECHGLEGEGGRGPNLGNGDFYSGDTDADLYRNVEQGIPGSAMLGLPESPERLWQIVGFVRSLNRAAEPSDLPGDPERGETMFRDRGACLACHRVGRQGNAAGPDLTTIGSRRSLEHLRASLERPDEEVVPRYWVATVKAPGGRPATGFLLNEDRHSLQLLDSNGRLLSFDKRRLEGIDVDRSSTMESYEGRFGEQEMLDLISYLASLRKARLR
jgi:cytochrome c oxidase cbb3-type subunit 3